MAEPDIMTLHHSRIKNLSANHNYAEAGQLAVERAMHAVLGLTLATMAVEIVGGYWLGSMALLADGWHMASHAAAFGVNAYAYYFARKQAGNAEYSFGTWKVGVLAGFATALLLFGIGVSVFAESAGKLFVPGDTQYGPALWIALLGLAVNLGCIAVLHRGAKGHTHGMAFADDKEHGHCHHGQGDLNFQSAYSHIATDALTSVLAIAALLAGLYWGWGWADPAAGLLGGAVIMIWAFGLIKSTANILLDRTLDQAMIAKARGLIESDSDNRISDMHIWQIGPKHYAAIIALVTHHPKSPEYYKKLLASVHSLEHITIEVNLCQDQSCEVGDNIT